MLEVSETHPENRVYNVVGNIVLVLGRNNLGETAMDVKPIIC